MSALDIAALKSGLIKSCDVEDILRECDACLSILAAASDLGVGECESIAFVLSGRDEPVGMTLLEAREWCCNILRLAKERIYRTRIQQALLQAGAWLNDLREPDSLDEEQILLAAESGEALLKVLYDAKKAGVSDWITVGLRNEQITLLEAEELAKYIEGAATRFSNAAR